MNVNINEQYDDYEEEPDIYEFDDHRRRYGLHQCQTQQIEDEERADGHDEPLKEGVPSDEQRSPAGSQQDQGRNEEGENHPTSVAVKLEFDPQVAPAGLGTVSRGLHGEEGQFLHASKSHVLVVYGYFYKAFVGRLEEHVDAAGLDIEWEGQKGERTREAAHVILRDSKRIGCTEVHEVWKESTFS